MENLPARRDPFYAAYVPQTLSECIVKAAEHTQSLENEISLLRGMLTKLLADLTKANSNYGKEERASIMELVREVRATLKTEAELKACSKGMLHPNAIGIFGNMIVQIITDTIPDPEQRDRVQVQVQNRIAQLPVKDMQRG